MREVSHEINEEQKRAEAQRLADNTTGAKVKRSLRKMGKSLKVSKGVEAAKPATL